MPLFERPPLETLAMARDRWTPVYLEHGRLEVDDSSVKWIGADGLLCRLPVATISAVLLGPGTTVTHAAMKACADSNTLVCWIGEEAMRFYAFGLAPNHDNDMPRFHAAAWADKKRRADIARRMFKMRFPDVDVESKSIKELRGMEGLRVRALYAEMGLKYGVTWKGRSYNPSNWDMADGINKALSAANASLYALCAAVCCSLGYLPSLGFIHDAGTLPFIYDVADLYKHLSSIPAAFMAVRQNPKDEGEVVRKLLKQRVEEEKLLQRMPKDLEALFAEPTAPAPKSEIPNPKSKTA
jgi:CRISPR-associated protein Cas1